MAKFQITQHAKERYAERIMNKDEKSDIAVYVARNQEKIETDINKMMEYGELLYSGFIRDRNDEAIRDKKEVRVYLCGTWVLLADKLNNKIITLYKIDLKVGEDFNKQYVAAKKVAIDEAKEKVIAVGEECGQVRQQYREIIQECESKIAEYRNAITKLTNQKQAYQTLIDTADMSIKEANDALREQIMELVCKKEF